MKQKFNILIIIASLLLGLESYGQSNYYYYKGEKIPLTIDSENFTLLTSDDFQFSPNSSQNIEKVEYIPQSKIDKLNKSQYIQLKLKNNAAKEALSQFKKNPTIKQVIPNFITPIGKGVGMSDYFYVKLKDFSDYEKLVSVAGQHKSIIIEQNKFMPLWFTLRCTEETKENTLDVANSIFELGLFSSAVPDFLHDDLFCANDDDFNQLWGLNNSQNPNVDINICDAWNITEGNGINVAVLDQGIELTHNDLQNNISQNSYDSESNSSPSQIFGNHGTHVAGTIAAIKNNNLQVVGVAPQSTLLSVSNSLAGTPNSRIRRADGINWAWQNGADIISNSWGSAVQYDVIDDAIDNALTNGRNGLGAIVVFATGNDFGAVAYPANSNPNILSVGSITSTGVRSNFSNFGNQLDVVAPGSGILSTVNNNGTATFDGTSMATPHVSGVAALILSVNPNLTFQQVNNIIESTAQKVGTYNYTNTVGRPNGTWDDEMGYGLVDAFTAVQQAQQSLASITGPDIVCSSNTTFNLQGGNIPTWSKSYNLSLVSLNNNSITVKASSSTVGGQGYVRATFANGTFVQEDFWVGKPSINVPPVPDICINERPSQLFTLPVSDGAEEYRLSWTSSNLNINVINGGWFTNAPKELFFTATSTGTYYVTISTKNSCGISTSQFPVKFVFCSGGGRNNFSVSPNPSSESLTIQKKSNDINSVNGNKIQYEFFDFSSSLIYKGFITNDKATINVSNLKKGRYILKIYGTKEEETHHIIVE
jgi:subtilisin family serine protease